MDNKKNDQEQKKNAQDATPAEGSGAKTVSIPEAEYAELKHQAAEARENWDKFVRLQADFENTRKRWERDRAEFTRYANEDLLCDILTIVDDLEKSVELSQTKHEDHTAFLKGVEMILAHAHDLLKRNGVTCITAKGKCFDTDCHEALMRVEDDSLPENTVVEEMQKGYQLNGRVIRTAKVSVSHKKKKEDRKEA
ncbi:MAG: nucleotide exchange factor GrpE [Candidatus Omnitrophica bacterium]|nr:nucleotide exchange factor GrpE [Candidatus Omnitrophota bacterium]